MTSTVDSAVSGPTAAVREARSALGALRFQLDYLDAKLTEIGEQYAEDLYQDLAHDLHSAWDAVQLARSALGALGSFPGLPVGVDLVSLLDGFTARWDKASEPIARLRTVGPVWAAVEWAAARTRYELAFAETVRPVPVEGPERLARLREAEAELDRACAAVQPPGKKPAPGSQQPV